MLASAHVKLLAVAIWIRVTPASTPPVYTGTGVVKFPVELLFPSSPLPSSPQQKALPLRSRHEWSYPAATMVGADVTATGTRRLTAVAGLPSWPELFSPQQ